jgi:WD40 repeat protein
VYQPVFSRDGKTLYTVSVDGTAIAWDVTGNRSLKRPFTFTHDRDFDETFDRHPGRFSPDGRLIAVGLKEQGIALWEASDLTQAGAPLRKTGGEVKALAFSPDGRVLAAVTGAGQLTVWDVAARSLRHELPFGGGYSVGIAFSADGRRLAAAGTSGVDLWNVATGASLGGLAQTAWANAVDFSPDGALVAIAAGGIPRAELWHVADHAIVATLESGPDAAGDVISVAISPDGRMLALGSYGNVVRVWDLRTRKLLRELDHGGGGAVTLEFSRDSRILAISGFEPVATLWDVATGTQIGQSLTAGSRTAMIDLSSDGRRLLMTLANGRGAVWDVDPRSWARRACTLANRTLTRDEWEKFLPGRPFEPACTT